MYPWPRLAHPLGLTNEDYAAKISFYVRHLPDRYALLSLLQHPLLWLYMHMRSGEAG